MLNMLLSLLYILRAAPLTQFQGSSSAVVPVGQSDLKAIQEIGQKLAEQQKDKCEKFRLELEESSLLRFKLKSDIWYS